MMCLPPLTVAPGRATRKVFTLVWGALTSGRADVGFGGLNAQVNDQCREEPPPLYIGESRPNPATIDVTKPAQGRQEF